MEIKQEYESYYSLHHFSRPLSAVPRHPKERCGSFVRKNREAHACGSSSVIRKPQNQSRDPCEDGDKEAWDDDRFHNNLLGCSDRYFSSLRSGDKLSCLDACMDQKESLPRKVGSHIAFPTCRNSGFAIFQNKSDCNKYLFPPPPPLSLRRKDTPTSASTARW